MTEETLFELARRTPEAERPALLDRACEGKPELRRRVEALLQADAASSPFSKPSPVHDATAGFQVTASFNSSDPVQGMLIAGRYTLEKKLGEGGMGEVWLARQTEPVKRKVALKLIKAGMDSKAVVQRFEQERQALALMDHPNIARVLDAGIDIAPSSMKVEGENTGRPFFIMELVNGLPLTKFCDETKLGINERLELFIPICQAVQHAHHKGIVHRDLKPSNILITIIDGKPTPKVIDFGVAKATSGRLTEESLSTQFGAVVGTLEYMSPEQAGFSGNDVDTRADIYSLGVILYELLTGLRPIDSKRLKKAALTEMIRIIQEEDPSKPSTRLSTDESLPSLAAVRQIDPRKLTNLLRGELDWVVMKCLEKQRDRRYETANGLARDIQRYLADEAVEARPPSAMYRLTKFVRRNRPQVIAASLVLLALIAGVIGTTVGLLEARRQEGIARKQEGIALAAAEEEKLARQREVMRAEGEKEAKLEAERNLKHAKENLAYAKKGNAILGSVFEGLQPKQIAESGRPLQDLLRQNLVKAVKELEGSAIGDPLDMASMQNTLGLSLLGLGEAKMAIEVFEKAQATLAANVGPDHRDTLTCMCNLGLGYKAIGDFDRALATLEETLKRRKSKLGPDDPDTLASMNNLAETCRAEGKLELALPLYEETFERTKAKHGHDHPHTFISRNNLAAGYQAAGKLDQALKHFEDTLKLRKAKLAPDHPDTLASMNNVAMVYLDVGKLDQALPLLEETFKLRKAKLGPDHPETLASIASLAAGYQTARKLDLALPLLIEALRLRKAKLGPDHPDTLISMSNLAEGYKATGKLELAQSLLEDTLVLAKAKLGRDHPFTLTIMGNLGAGYRASGKLDLALPLLKETLMMRNAKLGPDHPDTLTSMNNLGVCYWSLRQLDKSVPLFQEVLPLREKKLGRAHPDTLQTMANLGVNYKDSGRVVQAIPLLEEVYANSKNHQSLRGVGIPLLDAYTRVGKTNEAAKLIDELLADSRKTLPTDSPQLTGQLAQFGLALLEMKRYAESEPLLRECLSIREKTQPDAWTTFNTQSLLGGALLGRKKFAEAESLLLAGYAGMKQREKVIPAQGSTRLAEALDRLIELYTETNKPDEVKKWQAEKAKLPKVDNARQRLLFRNRLTHLERQRRMKR